MVYYAVTASIILGINNPVALDVKLLEANPSGVYVLYTTAFRIIKLTSVGTAKNFLVINSLRHSILAMDLKVPLPGLE